MTDATAVDDRSTPAPAAGRLATALRELADLLLGSESFQDLMQHVADLSVRVVGGARTCGITMANGGRVITVASADELGTRLDEHQYDLGEGPCLEALFTAKIVRADDLRQESRWGDYPSRAVALGVRAVHSSPLIVGEQTVGVLNLYGTGPDVFAGPDREQVIAEFVTLTSVAITGTLRNYGDLTLADQLQAALNSRSVIDQAMGIIMASRRCTATEAFGFLRTASQTRNVRLAQIAQDLVDRTSRSGESSGTARAAP